MDSQTQRFSLPQWETDESQISRGDFNTAFANIDELVANKPAVSLNDPTKDGFAILDPTVEGTGIGGPVLHYSDGTVFTALAKHPSEVSLTSEMIHNTRWDSGTEALVPDPLWDTCAVHFNYGTSVKTAYVPLRTATQYSLSWVEESPTVPAHLRLWSTDPDIVESIVVPPIPWVSYIEGTENTDPILRIRKYITDNSGPVPTYTVDQADIPLPEPEISITQATPGQVEYDEENQEWVTIADPTPATIELKYGQTITTAEIPISSGVEFLTTEDVTGDYNGNTFRVVTDVATGTTELWYWAKNGWRQTVSAPVGVFYMRETPINPLELANTVSTYDYRFQITTSQDGFTQLLYADPNTNSWRLAGPDVRISTVAPVDPLIGTIWIIP